MQSAVRLVQRHGKAYLAINIVFYGLVALGTAYSFANPQLQRELTRTIVDSFGAPPLSLARDAYLSGNVALAALVTFLVNFFLGSLVALTVPSLLIPYAGVFLGFYRAAIWGVALAPTTPELATAMVPHSLTLVLEGQGYVLTMLGVHILWSSTLGGFGKGVSGMAAGYLAGLRANARAYLLVALVLAVAAVYEAFEVIYLVGGRAAGIGG